MNALALLIPRPALAAVLLAAVATTVATRFPMMTPTRASGATPASRNAFAMRLTAFVNTRQLSVPSSPMTAGFPPCHWPCSARMSGMSGSGASIMGVLRGGDACARNPVRRIERERNMA